MVKTKKTVILKLEELIDTCFTDEFLEGAPILPMINELIAAVENSRITKSKEHTLKILVDDIKKILNDKNYPILIDQEGGKVSRLSKIIDLSYFSQDFFGRLYKKDKKFVNKIIYFLQRIYPLQFQRGN